jgi:2',3'-cyclic-nucleotide 2'-phosphodiesterase (5'-nucleotidase family)
MKDNIGTFLGKGTDVTQLTIVQMNDSHAYLDLHPEIFWEHGKPVYRPAGGYARIATLLKQIRADAPGRVLFVDGGDTFHGTYAAVQTKGQALVPILNALTPAAMTAHWEFAYTPRGFKDLTRQLTYPMLAMNVYEKDSRKRFFEPYRVIEIAGLRIGIAGIASNIVDKTMPPHFSEGVYFADGRAELPGIIQTLREQEKVDLVLLNSHLGFPQDMQLMAETPGVDVDVSAHTHHRLEQVARQGTALVTQSGSQGSFLTRLDLTIENGRITDYTHHLIEVSRATEPDRDVAALVREALHPFREELERVVGETRTPLDRGANLEATMDNFLLAALLEDSGAQMAFSNGWRYGAPVTPGPVRLNDLYNMAPMNPAVSTVDITGAELRQMLEDNLEHTFSRDPFGQMGGYVKRALGIRVYFKIENPPMHRIHKLFIGTEEVRAEKVYRAAFITEQGVPVKFGHNRQQHPRRIIEVLQSYLSKHSPIEVTLQGTYTAI